MATQAGGGGGGGSSFNASRAGSSLFYRPSSGAVPYPARVNSPIPSAFRRPTVAAPPVNSPVRRPVAPRAPAPSRPISSGNSIGSNSTGRISPIAPPPPAAPPPPPAAPDINQWLAGDTTYKSQMDASHKALQDYLTQMTGQQNTYNQDYQKNILNLGDQQKQGQGDLENDYASRGLSQSGLMIDALAKFKTEYDKRQSDLASGRASFLQDLTSGKTNFQSTQGLQEQKYKQDAINRRASTYGA